MKIEYVNFNVFKEKIMLRLNITDKMPIEDFQ